MYITHMSERPKGKDTLKNKFQAAIEQLKIEGDFSMEFNSDEFGKLLSKSANSPLTSLGWQINISDVSIKDGQAEVNGMAKGQHFGGDFQDFSATFTDERDSRNVRSMLAVSKISRYITPLLMPYPTIAIFVKFITKDKVYRKNMENKWLSMQFTEDKFTLKTVNAPKEEE